MASQPPQGRLPAVLWFVAGALALIAAAIPALKDETPNWAVAAPGLFCVVMGFVSWPRK
jgi:hypothetical protein